MIDFKNLSKETLCFKLRQGINPLTSRVFSESEEKQIVEINKVIHSAIQNYEIDFEPTYVWIPGIDASIEIIENISIQPFTQKIADSIAEAINKKADQLSQPNIQKAILKFLEFENLIELRPNLYLGNGNSYYATKKGENCGIFNVIKKRSNDSDYILVLYSGYMQAYIIRMLPDILYFSLYMKYKINHNDNDLKLAQSVEPLSLDEQQLILEYRTLTTCDRQVVKSLINLYLSKK